MRKYVLTLMALLMLMTGCSQNQGCDVIKPGKVCFDKETSQFAVEEGATLKVGVFNEAMGQALTTLWDTAHPDHPGVIVPVVETEYMAERMSTEQLDVALLWDQEAERIKDDLHVFDKKLVSALTPYEVSLYPNTKEKKRTFAPMSYYGMVFATNNSMLQALGYDTADANQDGLPDMADSFEKLMAFADDFTQRETIYKERAVDYVFPFAFNDLWSFYGFLTAGNFHASKFSEKKFSYNTKEFTASLAFLQEMGTHKWYKGQEADPFTWRYEQFLSEEIAPFSLVGSWMYFDEYEAILQSDFSFSAFPSYGKNELTPLVMTKGYVMAKHTAYPSAASEVIRLLRSKEGLQLMLDSTDEILMIHEDKMEELSFASINRRQLSQAFASSELESGTTLKNNRQLRLLDSLYALDVLGTARAVFEGKVLPEEAAGPLDEQARNWLKENNTKK